MNFFVRKQKNNQASTDPFREVIEFAERQRQAHMAKATHTDQEIGEMIAYTKIVRASMEATGIFPREVLTKK